MLLALNSGKNSLQEACHVLTEALSCVQLANIETAKRQNKLFGALKEGNDAIKQLQKEVTVEQAEQLMVDSKEAQDEQVSTTPSQLLSQLRSPQLQAKSCPCSSSSSNSLAACCLFREPGGEDLIGGLPERGAKLCLQHTAGARAPEAV